MKQITRNVLALLLAGAMAFSMAACGDDTETTKKPSNNETVNNNGGGQTLNTEPTNGTQGEETKPAGDSQGLVFELNADGESYKLIGMGQCTDTEVRIPATYEGKPVTAIHKTAFQTNTVITCVIIPDGVTQIPSGGFMGCTALERVEIPDSVTQIGHLAFRDCESLKSIVLPPNVTSLSATFEGCHALENVVLPENLVTLGERVFNNCHALETIDIPATVTSIDSEAFARCEALKAVNFADRFDGIQMEYDYEWYPVTDAAKMAEILSNYAGWGMVELRYIDEAGLLYEMEKYEEEYCFALSRAEDKTITNAVIASEIGGFPVRVISFGALRDCEALVSVTIPASVTHISSVVLSGCPNVQSVIFERTSGWTIGHDEPVDVSDPAANVQILKTLRSSEFLKHEK